MILDDQDTLRREPRLRLARLRRRGDPRRAPGAAVGRMNSAPWPGPSLATPDGSALHLDEPLHEGEPEAEAAHGAMRLLAGLHEHVEDARQEIGRNAARRCRARADDRVRALGAGRRAEMRPPRGVYLRALLIRLVSTCVSRAGSPSTATGCASRVRLRWRAALGQRLAVSTAWRGPRGHAAPARGPSCPP